MLLLETLFNKFAGLWVWSFRKERLQHVHFSSEICEIFEAPSIKTICEPLLLYLRVILFIMYEKDIANDA